MRTDSRSLVRSCSSRWAAPTSRGQEGASRRTRASRVGARRSQHAGRRSQPSTLLARPRLRRQAALHPQRCVDITAGLAECSQVRVHFPFNSAEIDRERQAGPRAQRALPQGRPRAARHHRRQRRRARHRGVQHGARRPARARRWPTYLESLGASEHAAQDRQLRQGEARSAPSTTRPAGRRTAAPISP